MQYLGSPEFANARQAAQLGAGAEPAAIVRLPLGEHRRRPVSCDAARAGLPRDPRRPPTRPASTPPTRCPPRSARARSGRRPRRSSTATSTPRRRPTPSRRRGRQLSPANASPITEPRRLPATHGWPAARARFATVQRSGQHGDGRRRWRSPTHDGARMTRSRRPTQVDSTARAGHAVEPAAPARHRRVAAAPRRRLRGRVPRLSTSGRARSARRCSRSSSPSASRRRSSSAPTCCSTSPTPRGRVLHDRRLRRRLRRVRRARRQPCAPRARRLDRGCGRLIGGVVVGGAMFVLPRSVPDDEHRPAPARCGCRSPSGPSPPSACSSPSPSPRRAAGARLGQAAALHRRRARVGFGAPAVRRRAARPDASVSPP